MNEVYAKFTKNYKPKIDITETPKVMTQSQFYEYCKKKFKLNSDREIEDILYRTTANMGNNRYDVGTFNAEVWKKEGEDRFVRQQKRDY